MHEQQRAELLAALEDRAEFGVGKIGAVDVRRDLDAAQAERPGDPLRFADRQFRRLEGDGAEPDEAVGMAGDDGGNVVVDRLRGGEAELRLGPVEHLHRGRRDGLDVDAHDVHVGEALLRYYVACATTAQFQGLSPAPTMAVWAIHPRHPSMPSPSLRSCASGLT